MKRHNMSVLKIKSENFADRIVKLYKFLVAKKEYNMSDQILRSGTSIGANISEAGFSNSDKDFLSKLVIASKERSETSYWLKRLKAGGYITEKQYESMYNDCSEIGKMLTASIRTKKQKLGNTND
jgi:four helix bundle protein